MLLIVYVDAATLVPFVVSVTPVLNPLHTVASSVVLNTGSGLTVNVMFCEDPVQPEALIAVTLYTTVRAPPVTLVNLSFNIALEAWPAPVVALPPPAVRPPPTVMLLIVYVDAATLVPFVFNVIPEAIPLQTALLNVVLTTGSGLTVSVMFCEDPVQPEALTPVTLYTTVRAPPVGLINLSVEIELAA
jgi:hypothetical protein